MLYRAYLTSSGPASPERRIGPLTAVTSIGRMAACTVAIRNDPCVSKLHAEIRQTPEGDYLLEDRKSSNGTQVAGHPVARHLLRHGDLFTIGSMSFRFELVPDGDDIVSVRVGSAQSTSGFLTVHGTAVGLDTMTLVRSDAQTGGAPGVFLPASEIADAETLRRDYEKLRVAHAILAEVGRPMRLDRTLGIVAERAFEVLPARRFAVLLVADGSGALAERLVRERGGDGRAAAVPVSRTLLDRVCKDALPLLVRDVRETPSIGRAPSMFAGAVRSLVCAPVVADGELFGVLYADNAEGETAFDEKDLHVLATIANQLALALRNSRLVDEVREEARRRTVLGRFLSPNLVHQVLEGKVSLSRAGETRQVAVLFTDIRGFSKLSERMTASDVTALLNEHFDCLVDVLFRAGGTFDKYIGDALMGYFGAPSSAPQDAETAVRCALDMQAAIERLNVVRGGRGAPPVAIGIGVAYGEVSWGPMGSRDSMSHTVVGDTVNLASRLCSEAKAGEVLVNAAARASLPASFAAELLAKDTVKGKEDRVEIWRVRPAREGHGAA